MKHLSFFFIAVFMVLSINTFGQDVYSGKILPKGNPCPPPDPDDPCMPGIVLWLETTSQDYVLTINSFWIWDDPFIFDGVEYGWDDEVEITGTVTVWTEIYSEVVFELEIEAIKKLVGIETLPFDNTKVYYDATNQSIVIDKTLQNQSVTLELYDMQGRAVLRKTDADATVSIANLPNGMYLYRLLQNNRITCSGKLLKSN